MKQAVFREHSVMTKKAPIPSWRKLAALALCEARATLATEPYLAGMRLEVTYRRAAISPIVNMWMVRRNAAIRPNMEIAGDYLGSKCNFD